MTHAELLRHLQLLNACQGAQEWAATRMTAEAVWTECERGDWLLWLAARAGVDRRTVVLAACVVVRPSLQNIPAGEDRPRLAVVTAERWARGESGITIAIVHTSALAASASYTDDATFSIYMASRAAYSVAALAAVDAAHTAIAADYAANAAVFTVAALQTKLSQETAAIVRRHIPWAAVEAALRQEGQP